MITVDDICHRDLNPLKTLLAGGIAGSFTVIGIPVDTLKSRYQTGEIMWYSGIMWSIVLSGNKERYPNGIRSVFRELVSIY